jgi:hydroxymethylpyrimidine pyrophosphatase-like HAD family hydrolase
MRYHALAADYDGTLAHDGVLDDTTADALRRLRQSGRRLLMVTGRELEELLAICPYVERFDLIVAENGALIYRPETKETRVLAEPPPDEFVRRMRAGNAEPLSVGHVIVATVEPYHELALNVIHDLGVELHVIFNKGSVMVLPSGVNKATGLHTALVELGLSPHNVVGVGDAENDHAFLSACECAVAVANALPALKERADWVTAGKRGAGVSELIDALLADDLAGVAPKLTRHHIPLGKRDGGGAEGIDPYTGGVLVTGTSGSGKSTLTTGLLERLAAAGYQFAIVDPEGDYMELDFAVALGSPDRAPLIEEVLDVLRDPARNAVVNLLGVALEHRPGYFDQLLPRLLEMRSHTGRPHWIVIDEAHHLLPTGWQLSEKHLPAELHGTLSITVHPESVAPPVLEAVDVLLAVGEQPAKTVKEFCTAGGKKVPHVPDPEKLPSGDAVLWRPGTAEAMLVHTEPPKSERKRHSRKYAEGNLGPERSFYFRGRDGKLNLKAHNLVLFLQMADGVDDGTWEHHRKQGDYSRWLRDQVKDPGLADEVAGIEEVADRDPKETRAAVRAAIEKRYTLPADKPSGVID